MPSRPNPGGLPLAVMSAEGYVPFPPFADWASLPVDTTVFDGYAAILDRLKASSDPATVERAIRTATRLAAIDTGAIEGLYEVDRGFTMTVAVEGAAWEAAIDAREPVVRRSFEDALAAYDYVLDIATGRTEISTKAIREIHAIICAGQDEYRVLTAVGWQEHPLPRGEYKSLPNNPTRTATGQRHCYAPPSDTPAEMDRLVAELRRPEFVAAHPILQAAYAHYSFVAIHPFTDGNGRVSRALASAYLYRRPGVPLVIFADQKDEYIDALEEADGGRAERFVRFIGDRLADIIGIVEVSREPATPPIRTSLASLRETLVGTRGLSGIERMTLAVRIEAAVVAEIEDQRESLSLPAGLEMTVDSWDVDGWDGLLQHMIQVRALGETVGRVIHTSYSEASLTGPRFALEAPGSAALLLELRDVYPVFGRVFSIKLRTWVERLLSELLAELDDQTRR
jgi:Fic family protein